MGHFSYVHLLCVNGNLSENDSSLSVVSLGQTVAQSLLSRRAILSFMGKGE